MLDIRPTEQTRERDFEQGKLAVPVFVCLVCLSILAKYQNPSLREYGNLLVLPIPGTTRYVDHISA